MFALKLVKSDCSNRTQCKFRDKKKANINRQKKKKKKLRKRLQLLKLILSSIVRGY